uniref:Cytochrome P450 monooxygenase n=1 Tax=Panonychus citri TaxID=50023 RepID=V9MHA8_PANCT|nr:cytochrome P450 monooxygenase [Panonychus citri]
MSPLDQISSSSQTLITAFLGLCLIYLIKWIVVTVQTIVSLPSGPWGYPIVGYLPFLKQHIYLEFEKLASKYGPVFSVKLGQENIVVICDWPHMKEAFSNEALLARPEAVFFPGIIDVPSFAEMSGDTWREHRRLSLHILRDIGLGKNVLENLVGEEIQTFLQELDNDGKSVDFIKKLGPSVSNNIAILLFGHKFDYDDSAKIKLDESAETTGRTFSFASIFVFLPWLARLYVALGKFNMDLIKKSILYIDSYIQTEVDQHIESSSDQVVDYIDGYLQERRKREKNANLSKELEENGNFSYGILRRNCASFFGAGSETVLSTMTWAMLYLIKYPEFYDKIQTEVEEVIGYERKPEYSDRNRMPFTMAFLYEVQRYSSVIPTNLFRRASRDTTIGTYKIPKDTFVLFNFWSVHHDPKLWTEPSKFDPSRFLTEEGTKAVKPAYLVPFSGGKRICSGEGLANVEMFLYLVCIVQQFRIKLEPGSELNLKAAFGISRRPEEMPNIIFERHQNKAKINN